MCIMYTSNFILFCLFIYLFIYLFIILVRLLDHFMHRNHVCLVFELLAMNLYECLSVRQFRGLPIDVVRKIAFQLLSTLAFLQAPDVQILHCDLKPENILLCDPQHTKIKVIDFGSACNVKEASYKYIQSRYYRSPEVVFGMKYSFAMDMWSLGCILVELLTGEPLFNGSSETDQVVKYVGILGIPPLTMIRTCPKVKKLFILQQDGTYHLHPTLDSKVERRRLFDVIMAARVRRKSHIDKAVYVKFFELTNQMLNYTQEFRVRPLRALEHTFFKMKFTGEAGEDCLPLTNLPNMSLVEQHAKELAKNPDGAVTNDVSTDTRTQANNSNGAVQSPESGNTEKV